MLLFVPVIVILLTVYANRHYTQSWRDVAIFSVAIISILACFFSLFTFAFAPGYFGKTLDKKLGIERREVSAEELYDTALIQDRGNGRSASDIQD